MRTIEHWIGGKHVSTPGGRLGDVYDPAIGAPQAQVHLATPAEVDAAVQAAKDAFESWSQTSVTVFTSSGEVARTFQRRVSVGMIGINVPIPVPMAFNSFGGWKDSLFGDHDIHRPEGVRVYTQAKVVTTRWTHVSEEHLAQLNFPTAH
jgi:acyl-CoA reductase-like NAD-dependent aldehyde dehydrogenase